MCVYNTYMYACFCITSLFTNINRKVYLYSNIWLYRHPRRIRLSDDTTLCYYCVDNLK